MDNFLFDSDSPEADLKLIDFGLSVYYRDASTGRYPASPALSDTSAAATIVADIVPVTTSTTVNTGVDLTATQPDNPSAAGDTTVGSVVSSGIITTKNAIMTEQSEGTDLHFGTDSDASSLRDPHAVKILPHKLHAVVG